MIFTFNCHDSNKVFLKYAANKNRHLILNLHQLDQKPGPDLDLIQIVSRNQHLASDLCLDLINVIKNSA